MIAAQPRTLARSHPGLCKRYLVGLRAHLVAKKAGNGDCAQGLGRAAVLAGLHSRELALIHENALIEISSSLDFLNSGTGPIARASYFFAEALVPVEAAQRQARAAAQRLQQRNESLRRHTTALSKVNRQLAAEVVRRKASQKVVTLGKQQYQKLFLESQLMQSKLRHVTRQIIAAQEAERKEISRELHDEVVQTLVGINVQLSALCSGAATGLDRLRSKIARTQRLVEASVTAVHRFARGLRPAVLDDLGLIPALHAYCKALAAQHKVRVQLTAFSGVENLHPDDRTVLYRVAQESLTNVTRHAKASLVTVVISDHDTAIRMEIHDNGKSFSVEKTLFGAGNKRLGLVGMKERVEMVGGTLIIASAPGEGTTVTAQIPFRRKTSST